MHLYSYLYLNTPTIWPTPNFRPTPDIEPTPNIKPTPNVEPTQNFRPTQTQEKISDPRQNFIDPSNPRDSPKCLTYVTHTPTWPTRPTSPRYPCNLADSKQLVFRWQIAKQFSGLNPLSLSNNKTYRFKKSGIFFLKQTKNDVKRTIYQNWTVSKRIIVN